MPRSGARLLTGVLAGFVLAGCGAASATPAGSGGPVPARAAPAARPAAWRQAEHVRGVVDLTSPGAEGAIVVEARGRLQTLSARGRLRALAPAYAAPPGLEPYLVRSYGRRVPGVGCRFASGALYALRLRHGNGVTVVDARARVAASRCSPVRGWRLGSPSISTAASATGCW